MNFFRQTYIGPYPSIALLVALLLASCSFGQSNDQVIVDPTSNSATDTSPLGSLPASQPTHESQGSSRALVLIGSLTVFVLAVFVGFEVIAKVPPTLHTPLMSGSNAISGITVVGAIIAAGYQSFGLGSFLGMLAIVLATINIVGGFLVTHRMLLMFKKR